jgi:hypothetical protein
VLKATVLAAVSQAKVALQDLKLSAKLVKRALGEHVPGQSTTYTETQTDIQVVVSDIELKEIDGSRIKFTDKRLIIFPDTIAVEVNDVIQLGMVRYRVITPEPIYVGDTIAVNQAHVRIT